MGWLEWHDKYDQPDSSLARRLAVVRVRIAQALQRRPAGPIRVLSMCAGDGRDLLGVLRTHARSADVSARLVELDAVLAQRARAAAPPRIEIVCADAGQSDAYEGAVPADLLLCCGVFGNVSDTDIRKTIHAWPMLCAANAAIIWTRGGSEPDRRPQIRQWIEAGGFQEIAFYGAPEPYGVGVARMMVEPAPYRRGVRLFTFRADKQMAKCKK